MEGHTRSSCWKELEGWTAIATSIPGSNRFNVKRRYVLYLCPENDGQSVPTQKIRWSTDQEELIIDSCAAAHSWETISKALGLSLATVHHHGIRLFDEKHWRTRYEQRVTSSTHAQTRKPTAGRAWTTEHDDVAKQMRCAGDTWRKIAQSTWRTISQCRHRWLEWLDDGPLARMNRSREFHACGTVNTKLSAEQLERLGRMFTLGESTYDMALPFGLSLYGISRRRAVHQRSELLGCTLRQSRLPWSATEDQVLGSAVERCFEWR